MTRRLSFFAGAAFSVVLCSVFLPALSAQSLPQPVPPATSSDAAPGTSPAPIAQAPGTITGTVLDATGAVVEGAGVKLTLADQLASQEQITGSDGQFSFFNVTPGSFQLTVTLSGFATQISSGILRSADTFIVPPITLPLAEVVTQVDVVPQEQIAEAQIKQQEKQRVLAVVPNFYVTYLPDAVPLTSKQKFELAWKTTIDPFNFVITGAVAGIQQAQNQFSGYGQGFGGYAKRYGAAYGDGVAGTFIGSAILPSLFKQDPRYFYKGTGGTRFRLLYALANAVICKGDDKRWQPNYSNILGNIAAGGIANLYYPAQNRDGAALTFESALIGIGASAAANVFQEFVVRKFTPNLPPDDSDNSHKLGMLSQLFARQGL